VAPGDKHPSLPPWKNSADRRTFLKRIAALSAAAAGTTVLPFGSGANATVATQRELVWKKAPCRLCGVGCGLLVGIQNGRAVAVKGDPDSPVSRGLACVKGYHSVQALYGEDRITRALIRRGDQLREAPLSEALDLVARRLRESINTHGKNSVALYGSAQWTIPDAYVACKFFKGALGTNNVETSARLYAASAAAGLESSFGLDGAIGCYEDIDHADVFVLWGGNLAESDPVLFSRMLERRRTSPAVEIVCLSTRATRTGYAADHSLLYRPQSELALANAVCQEIVARKLVNRGFVDRHVGFKKGSTGIGYGLTGEVLSADHVGDSSWTEYAGFLADYTPEQVQQLSDVPAEKIRWLASLYADRSRRVMSVWGTAVNQHTRGTWANNLLYNIHLLVGKIASPGNSPLVLTGQPTGGTSIHDAGAMAGTLPYGLVEREADRRRAAEIWGVPPERIDPRPGRPAIEVFRALEQGAVRFLWIQATNPMVSLPNLSRYRRAAAREDRFIVVSEAYPTPTTDLADVVLPAALWLEREGVFGNAERRLQHFEQMVRPPGDATSDAWLMIEVARRLGFAGLFPYARDRYVEQIWNEYRRFHEDPKRALPSLELLEERPGVQWPFPNGRETRWRYHTGSDPAADRSRGDFDFYGHPDHRAWIWLRPYEPPAESPDLTYPFWVGTGPVLEHWGTGSMTRRIPTLQRAMPRAYVEINHDDARALGIQNREQVRLVSRRGSLEIEARIDFRGQPPRGQLFVPCFDETRPVNRLLLDASCPLSGQPDYGKCAVRVERLAGSGDS
jgi:nitrate reductase (cytochrome)